MRANLNCVGKLRWGKGRWGVPCFGVPFPILDRVVKLDRSQEIPNVIVEVAGGIARRISLELGVGSWKRGMVRRSS